MRLLAVGTEFTRIFRMFETHIASIEDVLNFQDVSNEECTRRMGLCFLSLSALKAMANGTTPKSVTKDEKVRARQLLKKHRLVVDIVDSAYREMCEAHLRP